MEKRIEVQEAIKSALNALQEFYRDTKCANVLLEEVELTEDEHEWLITLGFDTVVGTQPGSILPLPVSQRKYKQFHIKAESGEVKSMKIREI